jgi:diadenosine tetraphosphate (Ap4A) HIT family hydrolase
MFHSKDIALARLGDVMRGAPSACIMCSLAHGFPADLQRIAENAAGVVVLDQFASRRGHLLAISKVHVECISQLSETAFVQLHTVAWQAARAAKHVLAAPRIWVASLGTQEQLPMSCAHAHLHILPIVETGEAARPAQVLSWSNGVYLYEPEDAVALARAIRSELVPSE